MSHLDKLGRRKHLVVVGIGAPLASFGATSSGPHLKDVGTEARRFPLPHNQNLGRRETGSQFLDLGVWAASYDALKRDGRTARDGPRCLKPVGGRHEVFDAKARGTPRGSSRSSDGRMPRQVSLIPAHKRQEGGHGRFY
jgi:hypothetical protein